MTGKRTHSHKPKRFAKSGPSRDRALDNRNELPAGQFLVEGIAATTEYARFRPKCVKAIRTTAKEKATVVALVKQHGLSCVVTEMESGNSERDEQRASPVRAEVALQTVGERVMEERLQSKPARLLIALDHIKDPRNLGAIVRTAAFYGIPFVIAPERRQVLLTGAAVSTAQGGFALCDLVTVVNLGRTLNALKDAGYWIIGTAMDGEPMEQVQGVYDNVVLVFGSEESGLSHGIRQKCDRLVSLQPPHDAGLTLESLNVSVAAGIAIHGFAKRP